MPKKRKERKDGEDWREGRWKVKDEREGKGKAERTAKETEKKSWSRGDQAGLGWRKAVQGWSQTAFFGLALSLGLFPKVGWLWWSDGAMGFGEGLGLVLGLGEAVVC